MTFSYKVKPFIRHCTYDITLVSIKIEDKTKALEYLADQLSERQLLKANVRAINVAIRSANTQYRRLMVKEYNVKYADTKVMVVPEKATYGIPQGKISGPINPISLSRFNPTFVKAGQVFSIKNVKNKETGKRGLAQLSKKAGKKDVGAGVSFTIKRGQTKVLPFAFLIQSERPGISKQIWARGQYSANKFMTGKERKPIAALKTVSPIGMMTLEPTQKDIEKSAGNSMTKEFERQVQLLLKQAGAQ